MITLFSGRIAKWSSNNCLENMSVPIVKVKEGSLRGAVLRSVLGPSYFAFKGIPFAVPPLGNLRFQDPKPVEPWSGIKDATKSFDCCIQRDAHPPYTLRGTEDCLYLNVFTNSLTGKKPVMFWIHGGAFVSGTGSDVAFRPDYLVTKDVVLVSTNYRLGAFGFLNLGHKLAPGNQGLKDLIRALTWTKENIHSFGGDPNNITIFGVSAGAALVDTLCRITAAKGLFQKGIIQSGSVYCMWGLNRGPVQTGFKLASNLGKDSKDPVEVVKFLQTVPAENIIEASTDLLTEEMRKVHQIEYGITIDDQAENPVLPVSPENLLERDSDIPLIIGYTYQEYSMFLRDIPDEEYPKAEAVLMERLKHIAGLEDIKDIDRFLKNVKDKYFEGKPLSKEVLPAYAQINGDILFKIAVKNLIDSRRNRKCAPTYYYQFSYVGNQKSSTDILMDGKRLVPGASHVDDMPYLFYMPQLKANDPEPPAVGTKDRVTIERMTTMWTNFAKTGNPTPSLDEYVDVTWKPVTKDEFLCLDIGDDLKLSEAEPDIRSCKE